MGERDWIWNKREDGISIRISGTRVLLGKFVTRRFRTGRFPLVRIFFSRPIASVPQNGGKSARRREFLIDEGEEKEKKKRKCARERDIYAVYTVALTDTEISAIRGGIAGLELTWIICRTRIHPETQLREICTR